MQVGVFPGVRSDPEHAPREPEFRDGEGNAIDGQRAFVHAQEVDVRRQGNPDNVILAAGFQPGDPAGGIHMALHEVPAESVAHHHRALEVDARPGTEFAQRGDPQRRASRSNDAPARRQRIDGETAAVDGHGVAGLEFGGERQIEGQPRLLARGFQRDNGANGFNESCEHISNG